MLNDFELQPDAKQIFGGNLDIDTLIRKLSISYLKVNLQPIETILSLLTPRFILKKCLYGK